MKLQRFDIPAAVATAALALLSGCGGQTKSHSGRPPGSAQHDSLASFQATTLHRLTDESLGYASALLDDLARPSSNATSYAPYSFGNPNSFGGIKPETDIHYDVSTGLLTIECLQGWRHKGHGQTNVSLVFQLGKPDPLHDPRNLTAASLQEALKSDGVRLAVIAGSQGYRWDKRTAGNAFGIAVYGGKMYAASGANAEMVDGRIDPSYVGGTALSSAAQLTTATQRIKGLIGGVVARFNGQFVH